MSRWTMPCWWAYSKASATCTPSRATLRKYLRVRLAAQFGIVALNHRVACARSGGGGAGRVAARRPQFLGAVAVRFILTRNRPVLSPSARVTVSSRPRPSAWTRLGDSPGSPASGARAAPGFQLVQHTVQGLSLDELHGEVVDALMLADPEDRYDVRVMQPGRRLGFTPEPLQVIGIRQALERQHLQGHVPAQRFLDCLVDDAHAAAGDLAKDAVLS